MLAALWQGGLAVALGPVTGDGSLWSPVPETDRRGSHRLSGSVAVKRLLCSSKTKRGPALLEKALTVC